MPALEHDVTVAHGLNVLAAEKQQVVYLHWRDRLWDRWHRRVERLVERKLGRPFRFNSISGYAVQRRWLAVLGRFVRLDVERRFGLGQPVSLVEVHQAYPDERAAP